MFNIIYAYHSASKYLLPNLLNKTASLQETEYPSKLSSKIIVVVHLFLTAPC